MPLNSRIFLWLLLGTFLLSDGSFVSVAAAQTAPLVITPPAPLSLRSGASAALTVTATGTEPLSYQWYRGPSGDTSSPVPGATGPLLVTPALRETTAFWVRVTNATGPADSLAASVSIMSPASNLVLSGTGTNEYGQLGDTFTEDRSIPTPITTGVTFMSAGYDYTLFVKSDGSLWATGYNASGQLGDGSNTHRSSPVQIASDVVSISAGASHALFIKVDGSLWAMGNNFYGQLGDGTQTNRSTPVEIATDVTSVSAGEAHTLFIKTDGSLWAVGYNFFGQLGDGTRINRPIPVPIAAGVASVSAGESHTLFVKTDGSLWGAGINYSGELGIGYITEQFTPVQVTTHVASVSAGNHGTLFVKTDGTLWAMGLNYEGSLGDGTSYGSHYTPVQVAAGVASVSTRRYQTFFVKTDGSAWAVGDNSHGQLGNGSTISRNIPVQILPAVASISAGWCHTLFLRSLHTVAFDLGTLGTRSGGGELVQTVLAGSAAIAPTVDSLYGWTLSGWDIAFDFITADLTVTARYVVVTPPTISIPPAPVSSGHDLSATLAVTAVGTGVAPLTYQWYRGESGDISAPVAGAIGSLLVTPTLRQTTRFWVRVTNAGVSVDSPAATVTVSALPAEGFGVFAIGSYYRNFYGWETVPGAVNLLPGATRATTFSARVGSVFFVKTDATLWAMGGNFYGQLGDGTTTTRPSPVQIATGVASVTTSGAHTFFVKIDGSLWGMGDNLDGQLGDGTITRRLTPVLIATGVRSAIADNPYHTFFIKSDGSLWAMGSNFSGELGDGTYTSRLTPVPVATGVVSVATGYDVSYFVKTDGSLWGMGLRLMPEDADWDWAPFPVQIDIGVASVATSGSATFLVKTDGSLWAMGSNIYGQLGDGTTTDRDEPVPVATGVASVSAGSGHTLFVKAEGSLWGMGDNFGGMLGNTPDGIIATPVLLATGVHFAQGGGADSFFLKPISLPLPFATWAASQGLTAPVATALADPDADGTPNLLEYAFGTSPIAVGAAGTAPSATIETVGDQPALVLTHRRRKDAQVTITYQQSLDLADPLAWTPVTVSPVVIDSDVDDDGLVETVAVSVSLPADADPCLFLRIVVSE